MASKKLDKVFLNSIIILTAIVLLQCKECVFSLFFEQSLFGSISRSILLIIYCYYGWIIIVFIMRAIHCLRNSLIKVSKTIEIYGNKAIDEQFSEFKITFFLFKVFAIKFRSKKLFFHRIKRSLLEIVLLIFAFDFISIIVRVILTIIISIKQIIIL